MSSAQQKFGITDFLYVTKLTREQLEAKYGLLSVDKKSEENSIVYVYDINDMGADWKLYVKSKNSKIIQHAVISTNSKNKNAIFGKLKYAFSGREKKMILIDLKTKTEIPYFTQKEFDDACKCFGGQNDNIILSNKTAEITFQLASIKFIFTNSLDFFSILTMPEVKLK